MTLLAGLAIRSSIVLGLGLLMSAALGRRSAALRHRVLAAALFAAACVVPFNLLLPEWTVAVPSTLTPSPAADVLVSATSAPGVVATEPRDSPDRFESPARFAQLSFPTVLWVAGMLVFAASLSTSLVRVRRIAARSTPIADAEWLDLLKSLSARYALGRPVAISLTDAPALIATCGLRRPRVLVPRDAPDWTLDRVEVVLSHELAHIRRHDWLVQIAAEIVRILLWFNPLVWIACTRLRRESEQACDDEVLGIGVSAHDYAAHLLALARQCRQLGPRPASAVPMAHPSTLERRIAAMLDSRIDRRVPSRRTVGALALVLVLAALPLAMVRANQGPAPLTGTIYDPTGAVIPGAQVTLVDANKNSWSATSNAKGRFELPTVSAGTYELQVKLMGFRALGQQFTLSAARDWDRAITLQVGELQETITVASTRVPPAAEPAAPASAAVRVGGSIKPPMKVKDVKPVYPPSMRDAGLTGNVPLEAIIGRDGTVATVRVLSAQVHPDFAIAAADAVRQWRFTPTLLNGQAVEVVMKVSVTFDLQ